MGPLYDVCVIQGTVNVVRINKGRPRYQLLFFRGIFTLFSFVFHINNSKQKSEY